MSESKDLGNSSNKTTFKESFIIVLGWLLAILLVSSVILRPGGLTQMNYQKIKTIFVARAFGGNNY